jgi:hypothetical protein
MWRSVYDSVAGTSHAISGIPCQDACRVVVYTCGDEESLVAVLSDGAGSAAHSHLGSQIACDTLIELISEKLGAAECVLTADLVAQWYERVHERLISKSGELGIELREMACTLLLAVIGATQGLVAQVGDGAIVVAADEEYEVAFWPQSGEYANTTNFITGANFAEALEVRVIEKRISEVALFSDGLERLALRFADRSVHAPFLRPMFDSLRNAVNPDSLFAPLRQFLDSPAVNERTDDDKTLILATRLNDSTHAPV